VFNQDFHIPGVGGLAITGIVAQRGAAEQLAGVAVLQQRKSQAAIFSRNLRQPKPRLLRVLAHTPHCRFQRFLLLIEKQGFERQNFFTHKFFQSAQNAFRLLTNVK
jgi:hypothetical protein